LFPIVQLSVASYLSKSSNQFCVTQRVNQNQDERLQSK
jgi:hypothetical protein